MSKTKVSVDVRVDPSDKATWQAEADAAGLSLSELVRSRMKLRPEVAAPFDIDLASEELQSLRSWLDLRDSDGHVDTELLDGWKAFAARSDVTFPELLELVVVSANSALACP